MQWSRRIGRNELDVNALSYRRLAATELRSLTQYVRDDRPFNLGLDEHIDKSGARDLRFFQVRRRGQTGYERYCDFPRTSS